MGSFPVIRWRQWLRNLSSNCTKEGKNEQNHQRLFHFQFRLSQTDWHIGQHSIPCRQACNTSCNDSRSREVAWERWNFFIKSAKQVIEVLHCNTSVLVNDIVLNHDYLKASTSAKGLSVTLPATSPNFCRIAIQALTLSPSSSSSSPTLRT